MVLLTVTYSGFVVYAFKTTLLQIWDKLDKCGISMKKYAGIKCEGAL